MTRLPEAERLRNHLAGAIQRALRLCDAFALHLAPGPEADVLAALARDQSDVPLVLVLVRGREEDATHARRLARHLGVSLAERVLPRPPASADVFGLVLREASLHATRLLLPTGGRDLLAGVEPPPAPEAAAEALAREAGVQLRYPYLDRGVVPYARRIAPEERSGLIERLAESLGLGALDRVPA